MEAPLSISKKKFGSKLPKFKPSPGVLQSTPKFKKNSKVLHNHT